MQVFDGFSEIVMVMQGDLNARIVVFITWHLGIFFPIDLTWYFVFRKQMLNILWRMNLIFCSIKKRLKVKEFNFYLSVILVLNT